LFTLGHKVLAWTYILVSVSVCSSASCCPYGCDEYTILHADVATLADLEQEAEEAVNDANEELRRARAEVHRRMPGQEGQVIPPGLSNEPALMPNETFLHENSNGGLGEGLFSSIVDDIMAYPSSTIRSSSLSNRWQEAENLVSTKRNVIHKSNRSKNHKLDDGRWPNPFHIWNQSTEQSIGEVSKKKSSIDVHPSIIDTDSYAVVTFTSRQAAIAARQCIADGCGLDRWREIDYIPIPPLADAPPWNIFGESVGCAHGFQYAISC
jgi:hypothetical protein